MIMSKEEAYKDYLDKYRDEIDNMIHKANEKHETHIHLSKETPEIIISELEKTGYTIEPFLPKSFEIPSFLRKKSQIQLPEVYKISWNENK